MPIDEGFLISQLVVLRTSELQLRWERIKFYMTIHSALLTYVITQLQPGTYPHMSLCFAGIVLSIAWAYTIKRTRDYILYWISCMEALEEKFPFPIPVFRGIAYMDLRGGISTHVALFFIVRYVVWFGWFILLMHSLLNYLAGG